LKHTIRETPAGFEVWDPTRPWRCIGVAPNYAAAVTIARHDASLHPEIAAAEEQDSLKYFRDRVGVLSFSGSWHRQDFDTGRWHMVGDMHEDREELDDAALLDLCRDPEQLSQVLDGYKRIKAEALAILDQATRAREDVERSAASLAKERAAWEDTKRAEQARLREDWSRQERHRDWLDRRFRRFEEVRATYVTALIDRTTAALSTLIDRVQSDFAAELSEFRRATTIASEE